MSTFFMSDPHLSHGNIIKYCKRPWLTEDQRMSIIRGTSEDATGEEYDAYRAIKIAPDIVRNMDDVLIHNINKTVGANDTLYLLGDFTFSDSLDATIAFRKRIKCRNIHYIYGNHDSRMIGGFFESAQDYIETKINGQFIVMFHYPILSWNGNGKGSWHLFGHCHGSINAFIHNYLSNARMLDVGVDNVAHMLGNGELKPSNYRPLSFDEVAAYMSTKQGFTADHHGHRNASS